MKRLDLQGTKIGMLNVLGYSHSHVQPSGQKRAMWDVLCDCGIQKKMSTGTLTNGTTSCGCYFIEKRKQGLNKKEKGEANFNYKYLSYRNRAKYKRIEFELSKEEFKSIILQKCFYCGSEKDMHHTKRSTNGLFFSNGIDRVDSNLGYVLNNCVACCKKCNVMKNDLDIKDFLNHIIKIFKFNHLC
jgi:5-methylcytosine-specific restriction endonuclease McrA